jgi:hypothetical protein
MKTTLQLASRTLVLLAFAVLIGSVAYLLVGTGGSAPMPTGEVHGGHGESASLSGVISVVQNLVEIGVVVGLVSLTTWLFGRRRRVAAQ